MDLLFLLIPFSVSMADFSKPSSFCLEICFKNPSILTLSGPGGGGSEARMAKLTAANQKPLIQ